jgi:threonine/homoserine/homoserine lactone efflux protein
MMEAFVAGVIAGYGVAVPVGAIAVLIVDASLRRGLRVGLAAGAGAATADGLYAGLAALAGAAIARFVTPIQVELGWLSVGALVLIAIRGLLVLRRDSAGPPPAEPGTLGAEGAVGVGRGRRPGSSGDSAGRTYLRFLALTVINPMTVVYFAALVLGLPSLGDGAVERVAFVAGVFLASISWQSLLAGVGAIVHRRLPARSRLATSLLGNLIVLAFATNIARGLVAG